MTEEERKQFDWLLKETARLDTSKREEEIKRNIAEKCLNEYCQKDWQLLKKEIYDYLNELYRFNKLKTSLRDMETKVKNEAGPYRENTYNVPIGQSIGLVPVDVFMGRFG